MQTISPMRLIAAALFALSALLGSPFGAALLADVLQLRPANG